MSDTVTGHSRVLLDRALSLVAQAYWKTGERATDGLLSQAMDALKAIPVEDKMTDQASFQTDPSWAAQITAEEERAVRLWLEGFALATKPGAHFASVALRLLARPVMPEEPGEDLARVIYNRTSLTMPKCENLWRALYAHLSRPKTKEVEVEVWVIVAGQHVVCSSPNEGDMQSLADAWNAMPGYQGRYRVVKLMAPRPHKQTVPA